MLVEKSLEHFSRKLKDVFRLTLHGFKFFQVNILWKSSIREITKLQLTTMQNKHDKWLDKYQTVLS